jgi:hypothetical protein
MGRTQPVDYAHPGDYFDVLGKVVDKIGFVPQLQELK